MVDGVNVINSISFLWLSFMFIAVHASSDQNEIFLLHFFVQIHVERNPISLKANNDVGIFSIEVNRLGRFIFQLSHCVWVNTNWSMIKKTLYYASDVSWNWWLGCKMVSNGIQRGVRDYPIVRSSAEDFLCLQLKKFEFDSINKSAWCDLNCTLDKRIPRRQHQTVSPQNRVPTFVLQNIRGKPAHNWTLWCQ